MTPSHNQSIDWRRSFNHENTNSPKGQPPLQFLRTASQMPNYKQLSPSAQAVLDATTASAIQNLHGTYERDIAAAIRSAVAVTQQYQGKDCLSNDVWTCDADELLAIADELDLSISH